MGWFFKTPEEIYASALIDFETSKKTFGRKKGDYYYGQYTKPLKKLERLAEKGHQKAQACCGEIYLYYQAPTAKNIEKGMGWYERAASQGDTALQRTCAQLYAEGKIVAKNDAKALYWYEQAAESDDGPEDSVRRNNSVKECGERYRAGKGTTVNKEKALACFLRQAAYFAYPAFCCGEMYYNGEGTPRNLTRALLWIEQVRSWKGAEELYQKICAERAGQAPEQQKQELEDVVREAAELRRAGQPVLALVLMEGAAKQGSARAQLLCAEMYTGAEGTRRRLDKALEWAERAARQGEPGAGALEAALRAETRTAFAAGYAAYQDKRYEAALPLLEWAARKGNRAAQFYCAWIFSNGAGVKTDKNAAREWYEKAAEAGDKDAQYNLALLYQQHEVVYDGWSRKENTRRAIYWYEKAAQQGLAAAQNNLANIYMAGEYVLRDEEKAKALYEEAAAKGDENAKKNLARNF